MSESEEEFLTRDDPTKGVFGELERRYARALFKVAKDENALDDVCYDMKVLREAITQSAELRLFLSDKRFDKLCASKVIVTLLDKMEVRKIVRNFVALVAQNSRLSHLGNMLSAFLYEVAESQRHIVAEVGSAVALTEEQKERIRENLSDGQQKVVLHTHVDPSLFGGFVVRVGDRLYDASLKARLMRLHYAMKGAA